MLHGALVLNAKSGAVIFAQRNQPAFGLSACAHVAKDEMRLAAMLFALHLNAASCGAESLDNVETSHEDTIGAPTSNGLETYRIGDVMMHFRSGSTNPILLVLFTPASTCTSAAAYLCTELMHHLEDCTSFDASMHPAAAPSSRHTKRQAFTAALSDSLYKLRTWLLVRLHKAVQSAVRPNGLEIDGLGALYSSQLCASLDGAPPHATASPICSIDPGSYPSDRRACSSTAGTPGPSWKSHEFGSVATTVPHVIDERGTSPARPPRRMGCFPSCLLDRRPNARRPAPHPPLAHGAAVAIPQLFWHQPSVAPDGGLPTLADDTRRARLLCDLRAAWHHRSLLGPSALYSPPKPLDVAAHGGRAIGKSADVRLAATPSHAEVAMFLIRAPLLLCARLVLRTADTLLYGRDATGTSSCAPHDLRIQQAIWATAAAVQPWESSLLLCQATLEKVGDRERTQERPAASAQVSSHDAR